MIYFLALRFSQVRPLNLNCGVLPTLHEGFKNPFLVEQSEKFQTFFIVLANPAKGYQRIYKMDTENIVNLIAIVTTFLFIYMQCMTSPSQAKSNISRSYIYLSLLLVHSFIITASTPYLRIVYNRWYGHTPLNWLYANSRELLQPSKASSVRLRYPTTFSYPAQVDVPEIDPAFFLHSVFGIGWVIVGHITLVYSSRWSAKYHRRFAYGAITVFVGHVLVSVYTLICNIVEHHPLPRMMLMLNLVQCGRLMIAAIRAIKNGDLKTHQFLMLRVYLYSTEGSGTVRQVEHFMWMLGYAPSLCQLKNNSKATFCVARYVCRLIGTRLLTLFHLLCLSMLRRDAELKRSVVKESRAFVFTIALLFLSWYFLGLRIIGIFMEKGGYFIMAMCEAFLPKPGVHRLRIWS